MKDVKQSTRLRPLTNQELIDSYDHLSGAAYEELYPFLPPVPPASDIKDNNEAPEDTSGITG